MTNARFLFEALGMIDDEIIEAYASNKQSTKMLTFAQKWGAVAACLLIVAVINVAFAYRFVWDNGSHGGNVTPGDSVTDTSTDTPEEESALSDYLDGTYAFVSCDECDDKMSPWARHGGISIYSDGTARYIEPIWMSAVYPVGTWTVDGDIITVYLLENGYRFRMENGNLVFIEDAPCALFQHLDPGEALSRIDVGFNAPDALTIEDYVDRCYVRATDEELAWYTSVSIYSNGTFQYNPPPISSIIFFPGTWTVEGDVFVLYSEQLGTNYLRMEDGNLVFIEEGSSNFTYANLKDGEVLERGEVVENPYETTLEFSITENVEDVDWSEYDEIYGWMGAREYLGTGYKKIISDDGSETKPLYYVSYLITAYPDYADGGEYVTKIDITDPNVKIYGIYVNSSFDYCAEVLHKLFGFEISYSDTAVPTLVAEKDGITIRVKKPTGDGLPSIRISVEVTNREGIIY